MLYSLLWISGEGSDEWFVPFRTRKSDTSTINQYQTMSDCADARNLALNTKDFVQDYSVTILLLCFTIINLAYQAVETLILPRFAVFPHLKPEHREEIVGRCLQFFFGFWIFVPGYSVLTYSVMTGCNANEVAVLFFCGLWLLAFDAHEFIRRWPLKPALLAHHVTVFLVALAFIEWNVLPPNPSEPMDWATTLLLSNMGVAWVTDFFHVVFRTSTQLFWIKLTRSVYLCFSFVRYLNIVLFLFLSIQAGRAKNVFGVLTTAGLGLAYGYNTYRAVSFAWKFDSKKYFESHQAQWTQLDDSNSSTARRSVDFP